MKKNKHQRSGTVGGGIVLLIIVGLVGLIIVRAFWLDAANDHYDTLIKVYISQTRGYQTQDQDKLKERLVEDGIFIKINKWSKADFIKDEEFYKEMITTYKQWQQNKGSEGSVMEDLINL